jgi:hypothetical protein
MTGCFSGFFKGKKDSHSEQRTSFSQMSNNTSTSTGEKQNEDGHGKLNPATPCYCTPPTGAPIPSDNPPAYTPDSTRHIFRPDVLKFIEENIDGYSDELRKLSLKIHGGLETDHAI